MPPDQGKPSDQAETTSAAPGEQARADAGSAAEWPDTEQPDTEHQEEDEPALTSDRGELGESAREPLVVVGIGASAGGLEALQTFFEHMPGDQKLAFVVVTHQAPNRPSLLPMLLARRTSMQVVEVQDGIRLQPDHVYIAPPGRNLSLLNGRLHTFELQEGTQHLAINHFFRSLAKDQRERAIAVVLSGTGSDGTLGIREIKAALGVVFVQATGDALFAGMPRSAIVGDSPDFVLDAAEIPACIVSCVNNLRRIEAQLEDREQVAEALSHIFQRLRQRVGHDFSAYKQTTMQRRIARRMNVHGLATLGEYVHHVAQDPSELDVLFGELLIGVTSFFRDREAFDGLEQLLREQLETKPEGYPLRVWVAGCSTGEEAYSLAILVYELLEQLGKSMPVQIFATDLDAKAIDQARSGSYSLAIASDVSARRLKRFFVQQEAGYQVKKEIREMLVFASQNLIEDPPFTKLDLLSCRNLLIYLEGSLQKRLFPIFHYVLKPRGLLLLGSSESIGSFASLFEVLDKKFRIYRRREVAGGTYVAELPASVSLDVHGSAVAGVSSRRREIGTAPLAEKLMLRDLVPPTVFMRERGEIAHIHGRTGLFLEPAPGAQASSNIYSMAREGLHLELAAAVREAAAEGQEVLRQGVRVKSNGHMTRVDLRVKKLAEPELLAGLFRVSFERARSDEPGAPEAVVSHQPERVIELERELQYTKESHQGTIEELETANEELKSTNEELQSTNEELQSANEELETSKEELQSLNEELQTVNLELQCKVDELSRTNDDMINLLNATEIATIFLDSEMRIKRHTEQATRVIRLIPSDVGRSIGDLVSRLDYGQLVEDAREVQRTLVFKEIEVRGKGDGKWYLIRILPYRTVDNLIDGLVVTFIDVTRIKRLQESERQLVHALQHSPVGVFGLDEKLHCSWAYGTVFGQEPRIVLGRALSEVLGDEQRALTHALASAVSRRMPHREQVRTHVRGRAISYDLYVEPQEQGASVATATCVAVQLPES